MCQLSASYLLGAYWKPNNIIIFSSSKYTDPSTIIPHELYHLHFWDTLEELGYKHSSKYWDLSEVVVLFVLSEFKSNLKVDTKLHSMHKEPVKEKLYKLLSPQWKNRVSFEEFLRKSIKIVDNNPEKSLCCSKIDENCLDE